MDLALYFNTMDRNKLKQLIQKIVIQEIKVNQNPALRYAAFGKKMDQLGIDDSSIEIDGIDMRDAPDFVDAYISYAEWEDGTELTDDELEMLNDASEYQALAQEKAFEKAFM
jgi:hypothetical protein